MIQDIDYQILKSLGIALLIGFAIGMQRTLASIRENKKNYAGGRTFSLIALAGYLASWLSEIIPYLQIIVFTGILLLVLETHFFRSKEDRYAGITTPVTALLTYMIGVMVYYGLVQYALILGIVIIVLLEIKPRLQSLEYKISSTDINAVILLLVMTFIVLPFLPNKMIGPYNLINPYKTWFMAILIAFLSFMGYLTMKIFGQRYGIFLTGAAGGFISSTAVTVSLSKLYSSHKKYVFSYAGGIAIACTFMYLRVLLEIYVVNPSLINVVGIPYLTAFITGLAISYYMFKKSETGEIKLQEDLLPKNPLQLSEALKFGLLFGIIYGATSLVKEHYGAAGVYIVSIISGITDVDAITLSLSEMAKGSKISNQTASLGIVIASTTNSIVKWVVVYWISNKSLGHKISRFFITTLGVLFVSLWIMIKIIL
jgi:uncharacterized membrane protein (DUF4010 family)